MEEKSTDFGSWTLPEIIEGRYFRVPDYQLGYAWGERQLAEFWEETLAMKSTFGGREPKKSIMIRTMPTRKMTRMR